jgi:hypothetical protein
MYYPWSSARAYAWGASDDLLAPNSWYESLAATAADRQARWREFLRGADVREEAIRQGEGVLGEGSFRARVGEAHGRPVPRGRGRPRKPATVLISTQQEREQ